MAFKLCSAAQVKDRITRGESLDSSFDTLLDQIIDGVTADFARRAHRPDWDKAARSEFFNPGENTRRISLSSPPIASTPVIQVWESNDSPRAYGADELLVLDTDYFIYSDEGIVIKEDRARWSEGLKTVKITYTGGHLTADATDFPTDLWEIAVEESAWRFINRGRGGLQSQSLEGGTLSYQPGREHYARMMRVIQNYRVYPGPF